MRRKRTSLAIVVLAASAATAAAQEEGGEDVVEDAPAVEENAIDSSWRRPLSTRNQMPLALLFAYLVPDSARSIPAGALDLHVVLDYSNIIQEQQTENETELLRFDLEYLRTTVVLRRGFAGGVELGLSVPFYVYYGGFLDPFVSSFHEAFGLPNLLRGQTPNGLVDYRYRRGDEIVLAGQEPFGAVGDVSLFAKKTLLENHRYALAIRGILKLPTGDPRDLSGSGATDVALGVAFDRLGKRFGYYANANYHFLGDPERFDSRDFFSFMMGADWRFKPRLAALLQVDYVRPPVRGELALLNVSAKQLGLGLRFRQSEKFVYEWRLVEDLSSFSPDFTFAFEIGIRWKGSGS